MGQKISLAEQETVHKGKKYSMISGSEVSVAGQSGSSYKQGANMKEQSSASVETGQCCFRQQERLQVGQ